MAFLRWELSVRIIPNFRIWAEDPGPRPIARFARGLKPHILSRIQTRPCHPTCNYTIAHLPVSHSHLCLLDHYTLQYQMKKSRAVASKPAEKKINACEFAYDLEFEIVPKNLKTNLLNKPKNIRLRQQILYRMFTDEVSIFSCKSHSAQWHRPSSKSNA